MNIFEASKYFIIRKIAPGFRPNKNALVIDIGSGDKPFWRADVFVDDLSLGDVQRDSQTKTVHDLGTFVDANVTKLPFRNGAFDFSFCCHLLEHVDDPAKAIKEITRISKAGYIEVPNGIIESVKPFVSHIWFIYINKKKLIFVRKSKKMHEVLTNNNNKFFDAINTSSEPFIRLYWKKDIEYEILDEQHTEQKYFSPTTFKKTKKSFNYYLLIVSLIRRFYYKEKKIDKLYK